MTTRTPRVFGICGLTAAGVALAGWCYLICLPYRLSPSQHQLLPVAANVQAITSLIAVALGIAARITGGRRIALAAMILGFTAFLLAIVTPQIHSWSPRVGGRNMPNKSLQATAADPSVYWPCRDSLLPGFVVAQFPRLCLSSGR